MKGTIQGCLTNCHWEKSKRRFFPFDLIFCARWFSDRKKWFKADSKGPSGKRKISIQFDEKRRRKKIQNDFSFVGMICDTKRRSQSLRPRNGVHILVDKSRIGFTKLPKLEWIDKFCRQSFLITSSFKRNEKY